MAVRSQNILFIVRIRFMRTYSVLEVADLMFKVNKEQEKTRILTERLTVAEQRNRELEEENEQLMERLADLETYYARERTKPTVMLQSRQLN